MRVYRNTVPGNVHRKAKSSKTRKINLISSSSSMLFSDADKSALFHFIVHHTHGYSVQHAKIKFS